MTTLLEGAPSEELTEIRAWSVQNVDDVAHLRAMLEPVLTDLSALVPTTRRKIDQIVLVASELATIALRHGGQPATVRLLHSRDAIAVDVIDHRPGAVPFIGAHGTASGGFGLLITSRAASNTRVVPRP